MKEGTSRDRAQLRPLRIGIIGAGQMARQHARAVGRVGNVVLTAVVDPDASALAEIRREHPGATGFASLEKLIDAKLVDAVHICTPPNTHEILAERALRAGLHIYVEKPFVESSLAARRLVALAEERGLQICAGHQLLYEPPSLRAFELLPALGELTHVESYFSFRAMKHTPSGRAALRDDLQLLDILPHPVYLLLECLERAGDGTTRLQSVEIGPKGTVHALVRRGSLTATLVVTLEGRPVESYLRVVGTNGSVYADYVRSTVQTNIGPGASGIDKLISPYRLSRQLFAGTTASMARRFLKRQRSYPGLAEIFAEFYAAIRGDRTSPVTKANLLETVSICEQIAAALHASHATAPVRSARAHRSPVVVTGGTGFLGREIARSLAAVGEDVRVVARRTPPAWDTLAGVEYVIADISQAIPPEVMAGAKAVVHCAAETAGGWEQHEKNSVAATEQVIAAAHVAGVSRMVHISSLSVLARPKRGERISEDTPVEPDPRSGGPYAWGKIESERLAVDKCRAMGIDLRVVRPSALVDYRRFDPPGLLGKRLGNVFVAVGMPGHELGVVDVVFSAHTVVWIVRNFGRAPDVLNLFDPELPTKAELLFRLRAGNPDLSVVWLPPVALYPLSWFAVALQKVLRPRSPAISVAKIFARLRYDTSRIAGLAAEIRADARRIESAAETATPLFVPRPFAAAPAQPRQYA